MAKILKLNNGKHFVATFIFISSYILHIFLLNFAFSPFFYFFFSFNSGPGTTEETHKCVFPFIYNGKSYNSCTRDGQEDGKLWCAITENYDSGLKWRLCNGEPKADCVFPFIFRGQSYDNCTSDGRADNERWCSLTSNADTNHMENKCTIHLDSTYVLKSIFSWHFFFKD
uniref:Fibronectin type-II domain-containing protein n=1 Tax=Naja naja TaxID=35670 RepID=A0A8C6Y5P5_NAJNA